MRQRLRRGLGQGPQGGTRLQDVAALLQHQHPLQRRLQPAGQLHRLLHLPQRHVRRLHDTLNCQHLFWDFGVVE